VLSVLGGAGIRIRGCLWALGRGRWLYLVYWVEAGTKGLSLDMTGVQTREGGWAGAGAKCRYPH
jgi:hypothetical protein